MIEAYNLLLLDQFTAYYKVESFVDKEIQGRVDQLELQRQAVESMKSELYAQ